MSEKPATEVSIPTATYRLQFNKAFTFRQAGEIVPYLHQLGISHVYASPYFAAVPGSMHGYDITNHNELNPEIGSREDYDEFVRLLHEHGMGQIVDFVPNHMGIAGARNPWWVDVLENGASSTFAPYFDIDWAPLKEELANKVLLPILGDQYGRVLERGEFHLEYESGAFWLRYYETRLPLAPRSYVVILKVALENLHAHYRNGFYEEVQSVVTALEYLPTQTETAPERRAERLREKEIIKRRLDRRCAECPQILDAIQQAIHQIEGQAGDSRSFDVLDQLLERQAYRLSYWRVAAEEINYRRFFDINDLAALRMELPEVFQEAHRLVFELVGSGAVTGLRIDHVDGLWNPRDYLEQLQAGAAEKLSSRSSHPLYLLVEKILGRDEHLHADWPVDGTTGYDFTNEVTGVLVDKNAEKALTKTYDWFINGSPRFADLVYQKKQLTMRLSLASEINVLGHVLNRLSEKNRWYRDFTLNALTTAVREVIACFPVYRTYIEPGRQPSDDDRRVINRAVNVARRRNPGLEASVFEFLREVLLLHFPENVEEAAREEQVQFVMKFQQCTGPIMAKGLEDTVFYVYNRLTALNEVGGEPQHFGDSVETFHAQNIARREELPHSMLATSTHDTKRSEDVRTRLAAISELPGVWRKSLRRWRSGNRKHKRDVEGEMAPDANEEYLLYQTLLGTWLPEGPTEEYVSRIQDYMTKAIKEAKLNSSWIQPNEEWDNATREFVSKALDRRHRNRFLETFEPVAQQVAQLGAMNALAQTALKLTVPGVPDIYQGNETWDYSLVDPDNRRPVDYHLRREMIASLRDASPGDLLANWRDGRVKAFLTTRLLRWRSEHPAIAKSGSYIPIEARGSFAECVIAFRRDFEGQSLTVIVPRLTSRVGFPPIGDAWKDTTVVLPQGTTFRNLLTGVEFTAGDDAPLSEVLSDFPVAALTG